MDLCSCSSLTYFILEKNMKKASKNPKYAEMQYGDVNFNKKLRYESMCVRMLVFYLSHRLVWVRDMGKTMELWILWVKINKTSAIDS